MVMTRQKHHLVDYARTNKQDGNIPGLSRHRKDWILVVVTIRWRGGERVHDGCNMWRWTAGDTSVADKCSRQVQQTSTADKCIRPVEEESRQSVGGGHLKGVRGRS